MDRTTIYRMLDDGRLAGFKIGGQWRFPRADIERWLQDQRRGGPESMLPPGEASSEATALPLACVQVIQDLFADVLGVGVVTATPDGEPLTRISHACAFCELILKSPAGRPRCVSTWQTLGRTMEPSPRLQVCHAGLSYARGRVTVRGQFAATVFVGQALTTPLADAAVEKVAAACEIAPQALAETVQTIPILEPSRVQQMLGLLPRLAGTFAKIGEERLELLTRLRRIAELTAA